MTFFGKRVGDLLSTDIDWLVKAGIQEGGDIEFKRALATKDGVDDRWVAKGDTIGDYAKRGLVKEIVGFANSRGGSLLLGIRETKEKPSRAEAITPVPRVAELADRLKMVCREQIEPALHNLDIVGIPTESDGSGVVVFQIVGQSVFGPHRHRGDRECYVRRNDETVSMDMHEIRRLSVELSGALSTIEDQFKQSHAEFIARHQIGLRRHPAFAAFAEMVPLSSIVINDVHRVEAVRPRLAEIPLIHDGIPQRAFVPARSSLDWRPQLRGIKGTATIGDRNRLTADMLAVGKSRLEWTSTRSQDGAGIYINWLVGMFANALLLIERTRHAAKAPNLPFALQFSLFTYNPDGDATSLLPYGERSFDTIGGFSDGHHSLPRYEVPDAAKFDALCALFETDLINLAGRDHPDATTQFDFSDALQSVQRAFA